MRRKIFLFVTVLIIVVVTAINVNVNSFNRGLSDVALANIEALADIELPEVVITCGQYGGACWKKNDGICFIGPYTYDRCTATGVREDSCPNYCNSNY